MVNIVTVKSVSGNSYETDIIAQREWLYYHSSGRISPIKVCITRPSYRDRFTWESCSLIYWLDGNVIQRIGTGLDGVSALLSCLDVLEVECSLLEERYGDKIVLEHCKSLFR